MKILVTIPHYYKFKPDAINGSSALEEPTHRITALTECVTSLHQNFGSRHYCVNNINSTAFWIKNPDNPHLDVVICTAGHNHILDRLAIGGNYFINESFAVDPLYLGYECRKILKDNIGSYDYYCYLEDDIILHDPLFFNKISWFTDCVHPLAVLQPNRFERSYNQVADKCYIDGICYELSDADQIHLTANLFGLDYIFDCPPKNPHSGCYFLNSEQMEYWAEQPNFTDLDASFIGPLESAATLGLIKTFHVYKPSMENAGFLEVEHYGAGYLWNVGKRVRIE